MRTYKEFIELIESSTGERHRVVRHGPKKNKYSRGVQRRDNSDRAALKKAGFRRSGNIDYHPSNSEISNSEHHSTVVSSYANQSDYARDSGGAKVKRSRVKGVSVTPTSERVSKLRKLRHQMGGDRTVRRVHDVAIEGNEERDKNDKKDLISRGKSFKKETRAVPDTLKKVGAERGDVVTSNPMGVMKGEDKKKGGEKRAGIYNKELGGKVDRRTGTMMGRVR